MVFFGVLLFVVLGLIMFEMEGGFGIYLSLGEWSLVNGVNLLLVVFI